MFAVCIVIVANVDTSLVKRVLVLISRHAMMTSGESHTQVQCV
jgi:hypothetical protein